jgi:hypothetical protein
VVYWEAQTAAHCAVHSCNNMMQLALFEEADFDTIAVALNRAVRAFGGAAADDDPASAHRDANGNYSIEVIIRALSKAGITCDAVGSERARAALERGGPAAATAFLVHRKDHWFALRKIAAKWYHLDSLSRQGPALLDDELLDLFVADLVASGSSVFHVEEAAAVPAGWLKHRSDAGEVYYEQRAERIVQWASPKGFGWRAPAQRQPPASRAALADRPNGHWFDGARVMERRKGEAVEAEAKKAAKIGDGLLARGTWLAAGAVRADTAGAYRSARCAYAEAATLLVAAIRDAEAEAPGAWRGEGWRTRPQWCARVEQTVAGYITRAEELDSFITLSALELS